MIYLFDMGFLDLKRNVTDNLNFVKVTQTKLRKKCEEQGIKPCINLKFLRVKFLSANGKDIPQTSWKNQLMTFFTAGLSLYNILNIKK